MDARERCMRRVEALDHEVSLGSAERVLEGTTFSALEPVSHLQRFFSSTNRA